MTKDKTVLLPCPFCGGLSDVDSWWRYRSILDGREANGVSIFCPSCDAKIERCYADYPGQPREDICNALAERWNTRPDDTRKAEQTAWLIEMPDPLDSAPRWFSAGANGFHWTRDANTALWFVRKRDAEYFANWACLNAWPDCRITEHMWIDTEAANET